jgi:hypothetical protein
MARHLQTPKTNDKKFSADSWFASPLTSITTDVCARESYDVLKNRLLMIVMVYQTMSSKE